MFVGLSILFFVAAMASIINDGDINKFVMLAGISAAFAIASSLNMIAMSIDKILTKISKCEINEVSELELKNKNEQ